MKTPTQKPRKTQKREAGIPVPEIFDPLVALRCAKNTAAASVNRVVDMKASLDLVRGTATRLQVGVKGEALNHLRQLCIRIDRIRELMNQGELETFFGLEVPRAMEAVWGNISK